MNDSIPTGTTQLALIGPASNGKPPSLLDDAILLAERGFWVTPTVNKRPYAKAWGLTKNAPDDLKAIWKAGAGPGIILGPGRAPDGGWLIDIEGDGPQAEESYLRLVGCELIETFGWTSTRSPHRLFVADGERLLELLSAAGAIEGKGHQAGSFKLPEFPDLEFRVGGYFPDGRVKQFQSVAPPTPGTDDAPRRWNFVDTIAELPETAYAILESIAERQAIQSANQGGQTLRNPVILPISAPFRTSVAAGPSVEERARAYARTIDPAISGQHGHDKTFYSACKIGPGFDLPTDLAYRILAEEYNLRCQPPWSEKDLRRKVDEAYKVEKGRGWLLNQPLSPQQAQPFSQNGPASSTAAVKPVFVTLGDLTRDELGMIDPSTMDAENVYYLIEGWLCRGAINLLAGEVGTGKSQTAIAMGAALNQGRVFFPDGSPIKQSKFIYASGEESLHRVVLPRLLAAGGDRDTWIPLHTEIRQKDTKTGKITVLPQFFANLDYWRLIFEQNRDAYLLIVDPIPAFMGRGVDDHRNNEVRSVLRPFISLLEEFDVACLGITHLTKTVTLSTLHRVCGSIAYAALARTINACIRDGDDKELLYLAQAKDSYDKRQSPYAYRVHGVELPYRQVNPPYAEITLKTSRIVFESARPDPSHVDALLDGKASTRTRGPAPINTDKLARFLFNLLKDKGPVFLADIAAAVGQEGFIGRQVVDKTGKTKWSNFTALYRGAEAVPTLAAPDDGWIVVTPKEDSSLRSIDGRARWTLRKADSPF